MRGLLRRAISIGRSDAATVSVGSIFSRLSILLLYFIAARALGRGDYAFLAYIVGVSAFLQIVFDPSSLSAFVVAEGTRAGAAVQGVLLRTGVRLVRVLGVLVIGVPALIAALVGGSAAEIATGASVGLIACGESVARFARTEWQLEHRFRRYAAVDVVLGLGRVATGVVLWLSHSLVGFTLANLAVGLAWQGLPAIAGIARGRREGQRIEDAGEGQGQRIEGAPGETQGIAGATHGIGDAGSIIEMGRKVWPYSASYLSASIYSNGPAVLVGIFGGVAQGALYSIVSRMTQPTELVPQALLAVNLPRLTRADDAERPALFRRQGIQAGLAGVLVAAALLLTAPLTLDIFRLPFGQAFPLLVVLSAILPPKFLSYQFVALLMAEGNIHSRLRAGAFVAALSIAGVSAVAWSGALAAALVTLGCECLLVTLLYQAGRTTARAALHGSAGEGPVAS